MREAVIPPQSKPTNFISVKMKASTDYVDAVVTSFATNEKYVYNLKLLPPFQILGKYVVVKRCDGREKF